MKSARSLVVRRVAATAALAGSGAVATIAALDQPSLAASLAAFFGVAAFATGRRGILGPIIGRGLAVIPVVPLAYELLVAHHFDPALTAVGGGAAAALVLSKPLLHSDEAKAEFAPVRFRRLFLTAATLAITAGSLFSFVAVASGVHGDVLEALGTGVLGASLLGTSVGLARMRGWGALLSLASVVLAIASMVFGVPLAVALLAAMPGILVAGALATARLAPEMAPLVRVSDDAQAPARARIATGADDVLEDLDAAPVARAETR